MAGNTVTRNMAGPQRIVFLTGLLLATISAILVFVIASSAGGGGVANVSVVTARDTIPAHTRITEDMLKIVFLERDAIQDGAYTSRSQALDHVATQEIPAGGQIVPSMLTVSAGEGLTFVVAPGMRAVSIEVEEVVTAGGNLEPGDKVDVIGIFEVAPGSDPNVLLATLAPGQGVAIPPDFQPDRASVLTVTLLQDVRVLGLAQTLAPESRANSQGGSEEPKTEPGASTATLELTPQQAQTLTFADEFGILRTAARPAGDDEVAPVEPALTQMDRAR